MRRPSLLVLLLAACAPGVRDEGPEAEPAPLQAEPSADTPWVRPVSVNAAAGLSVPAAVVQTADSEAILMAPLRARVVAVHVKPGDEVGEDDPIAEVIMPELETAVAQMRGADGEHAVLEQRHERLAALQREGLAVNADVVALEVEMAKVDTTRRLARAVLAGAGLTRAGTHVLRSPISGVVVSADARLGEVRHPDDGPLATIRRVRGQRVSALLPREPEPKAALHFAREGASPVPLKIVSSIVDASGFGYRTWFEPQGDAVLEAAARGRVEFEVEVEGEAWRLPEQAVARDAEGTYVLVADDPTPGRVAVDVVRTDAGVAIVRGALNSSMRVGTDPQRAREGEAP